MLEALARIVQDSPLSAAAVYVLGNVPGAPPIIQTVHLLGISAVMGSIVLVDLRVLGLALTAQAIDELVRRVMPWLWWALPALALSGLMFVVARPARYLANPVFVFKMTMLVLAIAATALVQRSTRSTARRLLASISLLCWLGVVLAGRWIAYADYLVGEWRLFGN